MTRGLPLPALLAGLLVPAAAAEEPAAKPVGISGYAQLDYRRADAEGRSEAAHEFNARRVRVQFSGNVVERFAYTLTLQGDGANANGAGILDVYVDVGLASRLKLRAGQYKYEFDMEARESASSIQWIDRSFAANAVAGGLTGTSTPSSAASSARDRGVALLGEAKTGSLQWRLAAGAYQGNGRASDNNGAFAYTANLSLEAHRGLRLNAGCLSSDNRNPGAAQRNAYSAWTFGAAWEPKGGLLRTEYYGARREAARRESLSGFYVTGSKTVASRLDLLVRFQQLRDDRFEPAAHLRSVDLGAKWYVDRKNARSGTFVAVNYMVRSASEGFNEGVTLLNDGRGAALKSGADVGGVFSVRMQVRF